LKTEKVGEILTFLPIELMRIIIELVILGGRESRGYVTA
jgi:hypothetical protein